MQLSLRSLSAPLAAVALVACSDPGAGTDQRLVFASDLGVAPDAGLSAPPGDGPSAGPPAAAPQSDTGAPDRAGPDAGAADEDSEPVYWWEQPVDDKYTADAAGSADADAGAQDAAEGPAGTPPVTVCAPVVSGTPVVAGQGGQVDILLFVDTSTSMAKEAAWVQENLNTFASFIAGQGIDYRVVLLAQGYGLCVPPPLGGPNCSDGERFRHVQHTVWSTDGLVQMVKAYPKYADFLRPDVPKHVVAVTDDDSKQSAGAFLDALATVDTAGLFENLVFHSIVAFGPLPGIGCETGADIGSVYLELSQQTGGSTFPICQTDWQPIFTGLAAEVAKTAAPTCVYPVSWPTGPAPDLASLQVRHVAGEVIEVLPRVPDAAGCAATPGGWHLQTGAEPAVQLCPSACDGLEDGLLQFVFGCG